MSIRIDTAQAVEDLRVVVEAQDGLVAKEYLDAKLATQTAQLIVTVIRIAGLAVAVAKWVL